MTFGFNKRAIRELIDTAAEARTEGSMTHVHIHPHQPSSGGSGIRVGRSVLSAGNPPAALAGSIRIPSLTEAEQCPFVIILVDFFG